MSDRSRAFWIGMVLLPVVPLLLLLAAGYSPWGSYGLVAPLRVILVQLGIGTDDGDVNTNILRLRVIRAVCALLAGGSLALAGAMMQGVFRNPLADPGLLGVGSGAALGAAVAIATLGDYGPAWIPESMRSAALVTGLAFAGAMATSLTIYRLSTRKGMVSIPTLLLMGLALNSLLGAVMAALQILLLPDWQVSRSIISWGFGNLDDRQPYHVKILLFGALVSLASIPFVGLELDLLSGGEEDATALGANPARIKAIVLACVSLATAAAVSVCGQIAFVGLLVPQIVRLVAGPRHRIVLPLSFLAGAALLLLVIVFQDGFCPLLAQQFDATGAVSQALNRISALRPGVLTSLIGAPFFIFLLLRNKER